MHVFPFIESRRVDSITPADVLKVLNPIWLDKPETARRVLQRMRVIFDWCRAKGFCAGDNPVTGIATVLPKHRGEQQHHAALPYQAAPAFIAALQTADTSESIRLAFELLILTATRTSEVLRATWTEVDLDAKVWSIPGARMKTGREHRVPLSARAVEIFKKAKAFSNDSDYVFPGARPRSRSRIWCS